MKIEPFKMKVTPEQTKRVQEILFKNGYSWTGNDTNISMLWCTHLYFRGKFLSCGSSTESIGDNHELSEITYQQFIDMYEFEFPEKWCVKPENLDQAKLIGKWFDECFYDIPNDHFYENSKIVGLYWGNNEPGYIWNYGPQQGFTEITFEQFKKYALKEETMEKEIIGYKLVKPGYLDAAAKIVGVKSEGFVDYMITAGDKGFAQRLRDAGVLDLWFEPIYKEEVTFKVGDWCYVIDSEDSLLETGKAYKLNEIDPENYSQKWHFDFDGNDDKDNGCWLSKGSFRKATEEEIAAASFKVGDWVRWIGFTPITAKIRKYNGDKCYTLDTELSYRYDSCHYSNLRKATSEEIEKATTPIFEKGDWVVVLPEDDCYRNAEQGQAQQIVFVYKGFSKYSLKFKNGTTNSYSKIRPATHAEVKAAQKIIMPFGKSKVEVTGDKVIVEGGYNIYYDEIDNTLNSLSVRLPRVHSYKVTLNKNSVISVGCKSGTLQELLDIYNKMNELKDEN